MPEPAADFERLLRELTEGGVEFLVVGGVSAFLQGAPVVTLDLDIVHRRSEDNVARLQEVLGRLGARYRTSSGRDLAPSFSHLESPGHQLLITVAGPLDVLGSIGRGETYEDLLPHSIVMEFGDLKVRVLRLEDVIRVKEELGLPKDLAVLEVLKATLRQSRDQGPSGESG
jgi:hypothetical protein